MRGGRRGKICCRRQKGCFPAFWILGPASRRGAAGWASFVPSECSAEALPRNSPAADDPGMRRNLVALRTRNARQSRRQKSCDGRYQSCGSHVVDGADRATPSAALQAAPKCARAQVQSPRAWRPSQPAGQTKTPGPRRARQDVKAPKFLQRSRFAATLTCSPTAGTNNRTRVLSLRGGKGQSALCPACPHPFLRS